MHSLKTSYKCFIVTVTCFNTEIDFLASVGTFLSYYRQEAFNWDILCAFDKVMILQIKSGYPYLVSLHNEAWDLTLKFVLSNAAKIKKKSR